MGDLVMVNVYLPVEWVGLLDKLVAERRFLNRSDAIRMAVRNLLREEVEWKVQVKPELLESLEDIEKPEKRGTWSRPPEINVE